MARRAVRDTYGVETIVGGIEIRRRVMAGQEVPGSIAVDEGDLEEFTPQDPAYHPRQITRRGRTSAEEPPREDLTETGNPGHQYGDQTVPELREEAQRRGLTGLGDAKKADIIEALQANDEEV